MDKEYILNVLTSLQKVYEDNLAYISELDAAIGDGDHGASMVRGFKAVKEILSAEGNDKTIPQILEITGRTLLKEIGGTCGPLYGMFFIKGAAAVQNKDKWETSDLYAFFNAGTAGLMALGKAKPGEKTMVDAVYPAAEALREAADSGMEIFPAMEKAKHAAAAGRDATKDMVSKRGRGRYQGDASKGHIDAGAASMAMLAAAFCK